MSMFGDISVAHHMRELLKFIKRVEKRPVITEKEKLELIKIEINNIIEAADEGML